MWYSDWSSVVLLLAASFGAGTINTVVGSGSLLTFPVLLALGIPPVPANIANSAGLAVGNIAGVWGYRHELKEQGRSLIPLIAATAIGAFLGAILLLQLPPGVFTVIAPALIVVGCVLVVVQPLISKAAGGGQEIEPDLAAQQPNNIQKRLAVVTTFVTGSYGGYFGAAQGVIIVGALGVLLRKPLQHINAIKNALQTVAGWCATVIFLAVAELHWPAVVVIALGSLLGARFGAVIGKRIPPWALRSCVVVVGASSIIFLL